MFDSLSPKINLPRRQKVAAVGIDIDADGVAAVATVDGATRTAVAPLPAGAMSAGEIVDVEAVATALRGLYGQAKLPKQVRLGVASQGISFRMLTLPVIENPDQLQAAVRFQAQEQIPMPLEVSVLDHQVIGAQITEDGSRKIEVAVVAARRSTVEPFIAAAREAGLDPIGIDLSAFGMIRALATDPQIAELDAAGRAEPVTSPATLFCSLGGVTNLAIARDSSCLFSRVAQFSVRAIAEELATLTGLAVEHAQQWMLYVGLAAPLDQIEGDPAMIEATRSALERNAGTLADELRVSLDYFGGQENAAGVDDVVICGWGSAIAGLGDRLAENLGREINLGRPPALAARYGDFEAARLTLPYGLAMEK